MISETIIYGFRWAVIVLLVSSFFWELVMGLKNKIVIFYDKADFGRTALTLLLGICLMFISSIERYDSEAYKQLMIWVAMPVLSLLIVVLVIRGFVLSIQHSPNTWIGAMVAVYRHLYIIIAVILFLCLVSNNENRREKGSFLSAVFTLALVGGVAYATYLLIKGHKVRRLNR